MIDRTRPPRWSAADARHGVTQHSSRSSGPASRVGDAAAAQETTPPAMAVSRVLAVLVVAVVGFAVQQTAIVPAVQTVQRSLGSSSEWSAWLVTVYLIVATVATPAMGRLGDLHGRRRMLLIGLLIFAFGSVLAALAPTMPVLIVCRAVQGIGGAVYPLCLAIARELLPQERVTAAVAALTAAFGVGTAIGFVGGGVLAEYASWRWIFAAGAVLVAVGAVLVRCGVPATDAHADGSFDRIGTAVLTVCVIGLLTALTLVVPRGWGSPVTIAFFVVALGAGAAWVQLERRRRDPLVDVHVLRERTVAVANLATIGLGWALFSSYLLIPQFAATAPEHTGYGFTASPTTIGLLLLPLAVGQTVAASAAGWLSARMGSRPIFATGLVLDAVALGLLCLVHTALLCMALLALLLGVGAGLALESSSAVATQGVSDDVAAVSSAVNSTVRRLAGGVGGQVSTIVLASILLAGTAAPSHAAYVVCFLLAAGITALGAACILAVGSGERGERRST